MHVLNDRALDGSHGHGRPFLKIVLINNCDVSRQLAEQREACLLCLLPHQRVRGGSYHEEKLLLTSGGHVGVHLVLDCQQFIRLPEEAKSQAQGHAYDTSLSYYLHNAK